MYISKRSTFNNVQSIYNPMKYNDVVQDKENVLHKRLYDNAINRLMEEITEYEDVIELFGEDVVNSDDFDINDHIVHMQEEPGTQYWMPSYVVITFKKYINERPKLTRIRFNLEDYWNSSYTDFDRSAKYVMYDKEVGNDAEVIKYDYIRGKATIYSRLNDFTYEVDFDELNSNDVRSSELTLPHNLFIKHIDFS